MIFTHDKIPLAARDSNCTIEEFIETIGELVSLGFLVEVDEGFLLTIPDGA